MKKLKRIEQLMTLSSRQANADYDAAYKQMVKLFKFLDHIQHSNHCKIINALYNERSNKSTYEQIAFKLHTNDNSLRRNRKAYAEGFIYCLEQIQTNVDAV